MDHQDDAEAEWGRFVPLLPLGTEQPAAKPYTYVCREGIAYPAHLAPPQATPDLETTASRLPGSPNIDVGSALRATLPGNESDGAGETSGSLTTAPADPAHTVSAGTHSTPLDLVHEHTASSSHQSGQSAIGGDRLTRPAPANITSGSAVAWDHHDALRRASLPLPTNPLAMIQFQVHRERQKLARLKAQTKKQAKLQSSGSSAAGSKKRSLAGVTTSERSDKTAGASVPQQVPGTVESAARGCVHVAVNSTTAEEQGDPQHPQTFSKAVRKASSQKSKAAVGDRRANRQSEALRTARQQEYERRMQTLAAAGNSLAQLWVQKKGERSEPDRLQRRGKENGTSSMLENGV